MSNTLFFHVGLHKCASTFLQAYLIHRNDVFTPEPRTPWVPFFATSSLAYDSTKAKAYVDDFLARSPHSMTPCLSHERLSGNPISGYYDQEAMARRLHQAAPNAKIILILREQAQFALSVYKQYIRIGGTKSLKAFLAPRQDGLMPVFAAETLIWNPYVALLFSLFGRENCLILSLEHLKTDPISFLGKIDDFMHLEPLKHLPNTIMMPKNEAIVFSDLEKTRHDNVFMTHHRSFRDGPYIENLAAEGAYRLDKNPETEPEWLKLAHALLPMEAYRVANQVLAEMVEFDLSLWSQGPSKNKACRNNFIT